MKEIWKDIKGYEKFYQVSNFGRVKSLQRKHYCPKKDEIIIIEKEKIIKAYMVKGYMSVVLTSNNKSKTFLVHRLVAKTFITNIGNKPEVNHSAIIRCCKGNQKTAGGFLWRYE